MDLYRELYARLETLPQTERIELLMEILPPQELFARSDGMRCVIRALGLRIFETSALLTEAGIPPDDPRTEVYRELRGGLLGKKIPNALRAIASREATVCRRTGAIQVWEGGRQAWWVPLAATSRFENAVNELIRMFSETRDRLLLGNYHAIRLEARERWGQASQAAYDNILRLGKTNGLGRGAFMERSMQAFEGRFPSEGDIREKVRMELVPVERPLPERIAAILQDVRDAERHRQEAEADWAREQGRLLQVERHFREEQLRQLEEERSARERLLRQAIDPQVRQAQEIVAQVEASLLKVGHEITASLTGGATISAATRRSWKRRLEALSALAPGNASLDQALHDLRQLAREEASPGSHQVDAAGRSVATALRDLERRASLEIQADQIWQLMRSGQAEEALRRVASLRDRLSNNLGEVEALWEMVVEIGAQNQLLDLPAVAGAG